MLRIGSFVWYNKRNHKDDLLQTYNCKKYTGYKV